MEAGNASRPLTLHYAPQARIFAFFSEPALETGREAARARGTIGDAMITNDNNCERRESVYGRVLDAVRQVPRGRVATYGQIALFVGGCAPRMVGFCLASLDYDSDVPWQRIINHKGMISPRNSGHGGALQRELLVEEGVEFDERGRVNLRKYGWLEPD